MDSTPKPSAQPRPDLASTGQLLRAMNAIAAEPDLDQRGRILRLLELGCAQFGLRLGVVTCRDGGALRILHVVGTPQVLREGDVLEPAETFCNEVLEAGAPLSLADASVEPPWNGRPGYLDFGLRAYLGFPLRLNRRTWGTLCFFDQEPLRGPVSELDLKLLGLIASRVQLGLENDQLLRNLRAVARAAAGAAGDEVYTSIVEQLARSLDADMSFLAACSEEDASSARTVAVWKDGQPAPGFEYDTRDTPCHRYRPAEVRHFAESVQQAFPDDADLADEGIEGYVGTSLVDSSGAVLGHLVALRRRRLELDEHDRWLLEILAARAATELERMRAQSEQLRLEREVFHAEKMIGLGVLAGGIAHDFNNLLMGILGNVDLCLDMVEGSSELDLRIRRIRAAAVRAEELTKQMLVYAGEGPLSVEPMCLNETVQEIPDLISSAVSDKARVDCEFASGPLPMEGDAAQVRQVVMGLVLNAAEATLDAQGPVTVRTGRAKLLAAELGRMDVRGSAQPGEFVFVEVADEGSGMDDTTRRRMFDPFFSSRPAGRGMGLSTVQGIVRRHGGAIDVQTGVGAGTRVRVVFPAGVAPSSGSQPRTNLNAIQESRRKTVLIVEDEDEVRDVVRAMLSARKMKVVTTRGGVEALAALEAFPGQVDLALIDLSMPGMNGIELAEHVHRLDATIPILLMSGFGEHAATASHLEEHGVVAFIQKPFDFTELLEKLREVMAAAAP